MMVVRNEEGRCDKDGNGEDRQDCRLEGETTEMSLARHRFLSGRRPTVADDATKRNY